MRNFFSMDNGLFRALGRLADLMILNICFIICCIPIVTIGAAITGMYYVTLKMAANEEGYIFRAFLKSFRQNFRQATVIWLLLLAAGCILTADFLILRTGTGTFVSVLKVLIAATTLVYAMVVLYAFPTLSRFDNTVKATFRNAFIIALADLPRTILMLAVTAGAVILTLWNGYTFWYGLLVWILFGFSCLAYINSFFLNKIFKKYIPEEAEESGKITEA